MHRYPTLHEHPHQQPKSEIELFFGLRNLKDMSTFSLTDAQCVIHYKTQGFNHYQLVGKTEVIVDNLNPDFTTSFKFDYIFEVHQFIKVEVRNVTDKQGNK